MSFSSEAKSELTRVVNSTRDEDIAELAGFVKLAGSFQIAGLGKMNLKISTEQNSIARMIFKYLKKIFDINAQISVNRNQVLKKNNSYHIRVTHEMGSEKLMKSLGVLEDREGFYPSEEVPKALLKNDDCKKAYIRGAFLGGGSINDPEKNYHLEIVTNNSNYANSLMSLINSLGFNSKIVVRKMNDVVYLKESEMISDFLNIIGAHSSLLEMQNIKIIKEMRNNVNRIVNCETANLSKTVNTAVRQIESINYIQNTIGISKLPENLQDIALLRVENEDLSLKELGELMNPPLGKSGVNHRLKKIEQIANDLKNKAK